MHSVWRAGFDECHGSDICDGSNNWANVQTRGSGTGPALTGVIDQGRSSKMGC